jgi:teichoic acid glycerol-phosphate primase
MEKLQTAGLIYGLQKHHLDHIAPMAILMGIPLIVTEPHLEELATKYYPQLVTFCFDYPEVGEKIVQEFDVIISSIPRDLFDQIVFIAENLRQKRVLNIWCPHGNSDKGYSSYFMEGLHREEIALVYGQKMIDFMIEKKVYSQLYAAIIVGNYRYDHYQKCAPFYDDLVQKEIASKLKQGNPTILYAPTWNDAENSSSFQNAIDLLIKNIPSTWNLIVKPHPNTLEKMDDPDRWDNKENILIIKDFPLIYPLLNFVDIYLGDMSSIGYDFLTFKKPMFFLKTNQRDPKTDKGLYLYRCGTVIESKNFGKIFSIIEKHRASSYKKIQEEVYAYVFGSCENLKKKIEETYERFLFS